MIGLILYRIICKYNNSFFVYLFLPYFRVIAYPLNTNLTVTKCFFSSFMIIDFYWWLFIILQAVALLRLNL